MALGSAKSIPSREEFQPRPDKDISTLPWYEWLFSNSDYVVRTSFNATRVIALTTRRGPPFNIPCFMLGDQRARAAGEQHLVKRNHMYCVRIIAEPR